jgi:hypothetical protein
MSYGVADAEVPAALVEEQNGEEVVGENSLDNFGHVGQELIEIERGGCDGGDLEEEVQELAPLAEPDRGFTCGLH